MHAYNGLYTEEKQHWNKFEACLIKDVYVFIGDTYYNNKTFLSFNYNN